jgi:haloacetate dehalogenase
LHVLWGDRGVVHRLFDPIADWQAVCEGPVSGQSLHAGHFIAEEQPQACALALSRFFMGEC